MTEYLLADFDRATRTQILGGVDLVVNVLTFGIGMFATGRIVKRFGMRNELQPNHLTVQLKGSAGQSLGGAEGWNSYAPMSTDLPRGRGFRSASRAGARSALPASTAGASWRRRRSFAATFTNNDSGSVMIRL